MTTVERPDGSFGLNPVTGRLVLLCSQVGMSSITVANVEEFFERAWIYQRVTACLHHEALPRPVGLDEGLRFGDVVAHVGLRTSATDRSFAEFLAEMADRLHLAGREATRDAVDRHLAGSPRRPSLVR